MCSLIVILFLLYFFLDFNYFFRSILVGVSTWLKSLMFAASDPFEENITYGICLPTDIDWLCHMNNARYLRECDFARMKLWTDCGIHKILRKLGGSMVLGASTIRYRRSINLFDVYRIKTKILYWDEKAFYLEQRIERTKDSFVCAIMMGKQAVLKTKPDVVLRHLLGRAIESPVIPEELKKWIDSNEISSQNLRKER